MKIKKGDSVVVTAGKDRGKKGAVLRAFPKTEQVLIDDVNVVKRHQKSRRRGQAGQIVERPVPIHVSNVALVQRDKPVRVGYTIEGEGDKAKKVRVARPGGDKI